MATRGNVQRAEADAAERHNRALLVEDVVDGRLRFRSRPVEAHIQFSTFCNQSCVMCWDGEHPPLVDMDDDLLARISAEIAPTMSVLIPHDGSEPTARRWQEICDFARRHDLELDLTTNLQVLTPERLDAAIDVIGQLHLSVDSHLPDVLERMRPGARPAAVLRHLVTTVEAARRADIDCDVNVVFSTHNAATLADSVAWFGDIGVEAVCLLRLMDTNGRSAHLDPVTVWPRSEVRRVLGEITAAARTSGVNLWNQIDGEDVYADVPTRRDRESVRTSPAHRRAENASDELARLRPGYCRFVHSGLRVNVEGDVAPCGYGAPGELSLGNLRSSRFTSIWNGATAQDLRRAMITGDLPPVCRTCPHSRPHQPTSDLPMWDSVPPAPDAASIQARLSVVAPSHGTRSVDPPRFLLSGTVGRADRVTLHLAPGGGDEVLSVELLRRRRGTRVEYHLPAQVWEDLPTNVGIWWVLSVEHGGTSARIGDAAEVMVRDQPLPRIAGSRLRYDRPHELRGVGEPERDPDLVTAVPVVIR